MITDLALTGVAIVVFLIMAGLAWRPFQRRHIDRPLPTDPAAQAANIGGIIGGGCIVLAFVAVVAVAVLAALLLALEAMP
jgi:hypothetical protein